MDTIHNKRTIDSIKTFIKPSRFIKSFIFDKIGTHSPGEKKNLMVIYNMPGLPRPKGRPRKERMPTGPVVITRANARSNPYSRQMRKIAKSVLTGQQEHKYFDIKGTVSANLTKTTADGTLTPLAQIPQGDIDSTRDGDECVVKRLRMKMHFACDQNLYGAHARIIIFAWKPAYGAYPPVSASILNATGDAFLPFYMTNRDLRSQYKIIYDRSFDFIGNLSANTYQTSKSDYNININIPFKSHKIQWVAGSTTNQMNGLYMLVYSDTATQLGTLAYVSRVEFTDS